MDYGRGSDLHQLPRRVSGFARLADDCVAQSPIYVVCCVPKSRIRTRLERSRVSTRHIHGSDRAEAIRNCPARTGLPLQHSEWGTCDANSRTASLVFQSLDLDAPCFDWATWHGPRRLQSSAFNFQECTPAPSRGSAAPCASCAASAARALWTSMRHLRLVLAALSSTECNLHHPLLLRLDGRWACLRDNNSTPVPIKVISDVR